ncbi:MULTISPECIES: type I 3-dehydroquinate dehydratase [unclassified Streptococcus]|uniref:type I 3-dehydroquinate dehydratase n=1 Tax=unclassified Streptococcus TaxID=2608887 RepID=UPI0018ABF460|nr:MULTISPECIES: type I 3-dehydroquinate dehydratase [unclassified Streptococcus]MBF8970624.1 type I 3-dehydroquinate dehydratase [Streptococcus sp. NLN76]MBG9366792.1 type I 3-dehydroquinate dehydratase [Streptococcus sp. NLN64]
MKLVVPIMPTSLEDVENLDRDRFDSVDMIEWRADYLANKEEILALAPAIFEKFAGREIVFTLRTTRQGGHIELSGPDYVEILREIQALYQPEYIDFEFYAYREEFDKVLDFSNLVLTYHNFDETPDNLMEILSELTALNPRIVKVAVKPNHEQDVLDLMNYTRGFKTLNPEQEYVTISTGKLGVWSRLVGDLTGSSWTFAALEVPSASGQLSLHKTRSILEAVQNPDSDQTDF